LGIMGGLAIPNSLIQIDLAALGISSINIVINAPAQKSTLTIADPSSLLQLSQVSDNQQPLPSMQVHPTGPYTRTAPVMRVYFRRKYKGKAKSFNKQTVFVEPTPDHGNIFVDLPEEYVSVQPIDTSSMERCKDKVARKRKCNTPTSTRKLRRSPRFIEKLDGHKPTVLPSKKPAARNKTKIKKVKSQSDLLGNILLPPVCQAIDFPGLTDISKYKEIGGIFPEIPIVEIQKVATETCRIAPSEVTAELLLASRPEAEAGPSRSVAQDIQLSGQ
jgi:hypothetical protein